MAGTSRVLVVEIDPEFRLLLQQVAGPLGEVESAADFHAARARLLAGGYRLLVTNLRLHAYNGLHLVYLLRASMLSTKALVYDEHGDLFLAREAQRAGAFYERMQRLPYSLPAYLHATLPAADRRDPAVADRRTLYRGGRRRSDVPLSSASLGLGV